MRGKQTKTNTSNAKSGLIPAHAGKTSVVSGDAWPSTAHPRACGENGPPGGAALSQAGSSPRMRGKPGFTVPTVFAPVAHPRACGENSLVSNRSLRDMGSSPRMRGKRESFEKRASAPRLIPAHAGKTVRSQPRGCRTRAHPRACGENARSKAQPLAKPGSSPRMRGKRAVLFPQKPRRGLIPAHAGKTTYEHSQDKDRWAHPRACGENVSGCVSASSVWGSSPRMRGKPV